jgi:predicted Zn-dependent protease with MMP-like domain
MYRVSDNKFEELMSTALDELPYKYVSRLNNVVIVMEYEPTNEQLQKLHLHDGVTLFGLYEGIPMTQRGSGYTLVLPDKITLFKIPIEDSVTTMLSLKKQIKHTLWHEIAHFFGLDHARIHKLDGTSRHEGV